MCREELASLVLRFSLALLSLVLLFSLPVPSLVLCPLLHHLVPARKVLKRRPPRTTKAHTTSELACQSPFAPNAALNESSRVEKLSKVDIGNLKWTCLSSELTVRFSCPATVKLFADLWNKCQLKEEQVLESRSSTRSRGVSKGQSGGKAADRRRTRESGTCPPPRCPT